MNGAGGLLPRPGHFCWLGESNKRLAWAYSRGVSWDSSDSASETVEMRFRHARALACAFSVRYPTFKSLILQLIASN